MLCGCATNTSNLKKKKKKQKKNKKKKKKKQKKNVSCIVECQNKVSLDLGRSSLTNEKDHHYFLNRFVCVGEFFDG